MRSPHGYAQIIDPDRPLQEYDTVQCAHCSAAIFVKPGSGATTYLTPKQTPLGLRSWAEEPGAGCYSCGCAPICLACEALGVCLPLDKHLDQLERGISRVHG